MEPYHHTEGDFTELAISDEPIVWKFMRYSEVELGYNFEGSLIAVRLHNGDYTEDKSE